VKTPRIVSSPADQRKTKRKRYAAISGNALLFTILVHVAFGVIAAYFIVEHFQKKHNNFVAQAQTHEETDIEHKIQVAKRNSEQSAPQDLKRIVTTAVSDIVLPEPPEVPPPDDATPTMMSGVGGDGLMGSGNGTGTGAGNGTGGNPFGDDTPPAKPAFEGTFYDFKQTRERRPTDMNVKKELALLKDFLSNQWDEDTLKRDYFSSDKHIYANEILIPFQDSKNGPRSFGLNDVQPGFWGIIYHAKITATRSGDFTLAGYGDDFLIVRINHEVVLDSGWFPPVTDLDRNKNIPHGPWVNDRSNKDTVAYGAAVIGPRFHIDAGEDLKIDVLISDANPANGIGRCGYFIMLLEADKDYTTKDAEGNYILPVLQLHADPNTKRTGEYPPFTCNPEDALIGPPDPNAPPGI